MNRLELVCPAGNEDSLRAAIDYGADSVYLGGSAFGARASAVNFNDEALIRAVRLAHFSGVRVLVTVNTLILENELPDALAQVDAIHTAGADGLIIQDLGLAHAIRERYPHAPLHGSTQMAIHNTEGAKEARALGMKRVVLARECTLDDIRAIASACDIEIEAFCHGALCVSVSGECLMSSMIGGRSGNRGRCAQPCRLPYTLSNAEGIIKSGSLLSPKDLCALEYLERMAEAGVKAFKIEGRLKRPGYVANMTKTYRQALDAIEHGGAFVPSRREIEKLEKVFARGGRFGKGYIDPALDHAALMSHNDPAYPETPEADRMPEPYERVRPCADAFVRLVAGEKPELSLTWEGHTAKAVGDQPLEAAKKTAADPAGVTRFLEKLGDTPFRLGKVDGECRNAFVSASCMNALRREAAEKLTDAWMESRLPEWAHDEPKDYPLNREKPSVPEKSHLWVKTGNAAQAAEALQNGADGLYWSPDEWSRPVEACETFSAWHAEGKRVVIAIPLLLREADLALVQKRILECVDRIDGILAPNPGIAVWALKQGIPVIGDIGLNITNPLTRDSWLERGVTEVTLSPEMTAPQVRDCGGSRSELCQAIVYGRLPLMTLAHCPIRASRNMGTGPCALCKGHPHFLTDRMGAVFPLRRTHITACQQTILNSVPMHTAGQWKKLPALGGWQLRFEDETPEQCGRITAMYRRLMDGEAVETQIERETTTGHWFRGVK